MPEKRTEVPRRGRRAPLTLVNLEKVMYPRTGTTKAEVLNYYAQVAPVMLPHLADRAVTRIRWPHGTGDKSFFEKNTPGGTPSWVRTVTVPTTGSRTRVGEEGELTLPDHRLAGDADLAGQPRLPRAARAPVDGRRQPGRPENPEPAGDRPRPGRPGRAGGVRRRWRCWSATGWPRDGLDCRAGDQRVQGPAPVRRRSTASATYDEVRDYAKEIAEELEKAQPKLVVSQMTKARRGGKVFLDWSQNTGAKTTISPYSLRGRELPMVAAPRTWDEVEAGAEDPLALEHLRFEEVLERVQDEGDLFALEA